MGVWHLFSQYRSEQINQRFSEFGKIIRIGIQEREVWMQKSTKFAKYAARQGTITVQKRLRIV